MLEHSIWRLLATWDIRKEIAMTNAKTSKCPMCDWELDEKAVSVTVKRAQIKVCCDDCAEKLRSAPEKHTDPAH